MPDNNPKSMPVEDARADVLESFDYSLLGMERLVGHFGFDTAVERAQLWADKYFSGWSADMLGQCLGALKSCGSQGLSKKQRRIVACVLHALHQIVEVEKEEGDSDA